MARSYVENWSRWPVALPDGPYNGHTTCIPRELLPLVVGSLNSVAVAGRYRLSTDENAALSAVRGTQFMLVKNCNQGADRIYRLIDSIYNGTQYVYSNVDGVETIAPDIPPVPVAPRMTQMEANESLVGLVAQGILGEDALSPYPTSESVLSVLKQIRDGAGEWSEEEIQQVIQALQFLVAAV